MMWLRVITAVLAALQIVTAGTALADYIGPKAAGLAALVIGAAQAGLAVYRKDERPTPDNEARSAS